MSWAMFDGEDGLGVEIAEAGQRGAVVEQAGVEEIGRETARLGLELAEAQHALVAGEGNKILAEFHAMFTSCFPERRNATHHQRKPQRYPFGGQGNRMKVTPIRVIEPGRGRRLRR